MTKQNYCFVCAFFFAVVVVVSLAYSSISMCATLQCKYFYNMKQFVIVVIVVVISTYFCYFFCECFVLKIIKSMNVDCAVCLIGSRDVTICFHFVR